MRVEKLLGRLKKEFIKVNLLQASLDSLMFFLLGNLVLFLFSLRITESFSNTASLAFISFLFFTGDLYYRAKKYRLEIFEEKNPELREALRTARDNLDQRNIVSQALFDEVMERSRSVTSESIIPNRVIIQKMIVVGLLSFITVLSGLADFQIDQDGGNILPGTDSISDITGEDDDDELKNATEIYGEEQDIAVSDKLVTFNISGSGESESSEMEEAQAEPEDVVLDVSGPSLSEDVELAKKYSIAIKEFE